MKISAIGQTSATLFLGLSLFLTGCSGTPDSAEPSPKTVGTFTGQKLPSQVEELEGTPLYSSSEALTEKAGTSDAVYLLIAPQDPTKTVLIQEVGSQPADLAQRESKMLKLSGVKSTLESQELAAFVQENYQLDLQTEEGKVVVLKVEAPAPVASSTPAPSGSPTPAQGEGAQSE